MSINQKQSKYLQLFLFSFLIISSSLIAQTNATKYKPKAIQVKPTKAYAFSAEEVKLLDGPFKESQDAEAKNILTLNVDRLLAPFLTESGLEPKSPAYPGWETRLLPGVGLSFYLSGISRLYMSTGKKEYGNRINYILDELERCQQRNDGYLLGVKGGKQIFARAEKEGFFPGFGAWGSGSATPHYSMEKLFSGLRDVYRITHNPKALQIAVNLGNWLDKHMSHLSEAQLHQFMSIEYGGMNWVLADLYADTGDKRFLELSRRWQDTITVAPMVKGKDVLQGVHGNMQFPKFSGLAARYPYSGDKGDLFGARFFWESVVNHRTYATGGNTESEFFGPKDLLSKTLTPYTEENCNEYNMLRLTSLLNVIEPKVEYADYFERTLFNHILAAQNPADGKLTYHLPLMPGAERVYQPLDYFSCCTASGLDSYNRHAEYIYSRTSSALYVNLFIASELNFKEKGLTVTQETQFPDKDNSILSFTCIKPVNLDVCIRNPYWVDKPVSIKINGQLYTKGAQKDGYFHINRTWNNGDKVEIRLPMGLRTESMPDDKKMVALFYGPVLLAADLDNNQGSELVNNASAPVLLTQNLSVNKWLKPTAEPLTFVTTIAAPQQIKVMPFFRKKFGPYSVYWQQFTQEQWLKKENEKLLNQKEKETLESLTVDKVTACDNLSEQEHGLIGASTSGFGNEAILMDQCWRKSTGEPFGYMLKVSENGLNKLYCKFMGRGSYETWNCKLTIEGVSIQSFVSPKNDEHTTRIWEASYSIPADLIKGRKEVRVMFEKNDNKNIEMPRLIEMRVLKTN